ncbi:hypothetical protein [Streptomyces daliensis]|uniref:Uncharacterized protein n=1 Tax=Streptomyces daliensis TaxID=299421 RepID=A0A8T4IUW5_9ACTN|nr:hypothetical protein [Streptomyces daliensis]
MGRIPWAQLPGAVREAVARHVEDSAYTAVDALGGGGGASAVAAVLSTGTRAVPAPSS